MIRILLLAFVLTGCSATASAPPPSAEPAPSQEIIRQAIRSHVRASFFDPYSIRDAQISPATWQGALQLGSGEGWTVCLRANAKNRLGGYTGLRDTAMTIRGGKVVASLDDAQYFCRDAAYAPFPDLTQG
jgi:hypothetical protein